MGRLRSAEADRTGLLIEGESFLGCDTPAAFPVVHGNTSGQYVDQCIAAPGDLEGDLAFQRYEQPVEGLCGNERRAQALERADNDPHTVTGVTAPLRHLAPGKLQHAW